MRKRKDKRILDAILYRDGKPLSSRTRAELALIGVQHTDPKHADYNPTGETAPPGVSAAYEVIATERTRSGGGKTRGEQKREQGKRTDVEIRAAETQLKVDSKRPSNKAIARITGHSVDHVRKRRKKADPS